VCDLSNVLTLTLRETAEKFDHVTPPLSEYWKTVIGEEPTLPGATTSLKPPASAARLVIVGRPGTDPVTWAALKVTVAVCSVVPAYEIVTVTGPAVLLVTVKSAAPLEFEVTVALACPGPLALAASALISMAPDAALALTPIWALATGLPFAPTRVALRLAALPVGTLALGALKVDLAASSLVGHKPLKKGAPSGLPSPEAMS
jgi:hypothetical protein